MNNKEVVVKSVLRSGFTPNHGEVIIEPPQKLTEMNGVSLPNPMFKLNKLRVFAVADNIHNIKVGDLIDIRSSNMESHQAPVAHYFREDDNLTLVQVSSLSVAGVYKDAAITIEKTKKRLNELKAEAKEEVKSSNIILPPKKKILS